MNSSGRRLPYMELGTSGTQATLPSLGGKGGDSGTDIYCLLAV